MKTKLAFAVLAVIALAAFVLVLPKSGTKPGPATATPVVSQEALSSESPAVSPSGEAAAPASGSSDDIANEVLQNSTVESGVFNSETTDKAALGADGQAAGNVGQSYDETAY